MVPSVVFLAIGIVTEGTDDEAASRLMALMGRSMNTVAFHFDRFDFAMLGNEGIAEVGIGITFSPEAMTPRVMEGKVSVPSGRMD